MAQSSLCEIFWAADASRKIGAVTESWRCDEIRGRFTQDQRAQEVAVIDDRHRHVQIAVVAIVRTERDRLGMKVRLIAETSVDREHGPIDIQDACDLDRVSTLDRGQQFFGGVLLSERHRGGAVGAECLSDRGQLCGFGRGDASNVQNHKDGAGDRDGQRDRRGGQNRQLGLNGKVTESFGGSAH